MGIAHLNGGKLYIALDTQRNLLGLNWKQVAEQSGVSASTLSRFSKGRGEGKGLDVDSLAALCTWAGLDTDEFYNISGQIGTPEPLTNIVGYLRADENLSDEAADAMARLLKTAYETLTAKV